MIFFDTEPPCNAYFSAGDPCTFDTEPYSIYASYTNLIAVLGTDYNPADHDSSYIEYNSYGASSTLTGSSSLSTSEQGIIIRWKNLNLYGSDWSGYTFSVEMRCSGHIRIHYDSVLLPDYVSDAPSWVKVDGVLSALRFGSQQLNRTVITDEQKSARASWLNGEGSSGTGVDGVYLNRDIIIQNDTMMDYCPLPTNYCLYPTTVHVVTGQPFYSLANRSNITLTTQHLWGCDPDVFAFRCSFTAVGTIDNITYHSNVSIFLSHENEYQSNSSSRNSTSSATSSSYKYYELVCLAPSTLGVFSVGLDFVQKKVESASSNNVTSTSEQIDGEWKPISEVSVNSLLTVTNSSTVSSLQSCQSSTAYCDVCGTCRDTPDTSVTSVSMSGTCIGCDEESPYTEHDCGGYCDGPNHGLYNEDYRGVCCERLNGSDCLGVCGGSYESGLVSDGSYKLCCDNVDCAGYCSGRASYDDCGICSGGKSGHTKNSDKDECGICFGNNTCAPTLVPTSPTSLPTPLPFPLPSSSPTITPIPSLQPSPLPSTLPSSTPTSLPTQSPSALPTSIPFPLPSALPSSLPSSAPTSLPTSIPYPLPSSLPSSLPSESPTPLPTTTPEPTPRPTVTFTPTRTHQPTWLPTITPFPTFLPSSPPTSLPSILPTSLPTSLPSSTPTTVPSFVPTFVPTPLPSSTPTPLPSSSPSQPTLIPTSAPSLHPSFSPTSFPSLNPSFEPTYERSPFPTSRPTHSPTLAPFRVTLISSAIVLDSISLADWMSERSDCVSAFSSALVNSVSLILSTNEIKSINASVISVNGRRLIGSDRQLNTEGLLISFSVEVLQDESVSSISNASTAFKNTISELKTSINDGTFSNELTSSSGSLAVLSLANVNIIASQDAIELYSSYIELIYDRTPTLNPTLRPTIKDNISSSSSAASINPLLILVIVIEIVMTAVLCVCCFKTRRNNQTSDPFEQQSIMGGNMFRSIDPSLFSRSAKFEERYRLVMSSIPSTYYIPPPSPPSYPSPSPPSSSSSSSSSSLLEPNNTIANKNIVENEQSDKTTLERPNHDDKTQTTHDGMMPGFVGGDVEMIGDQSRNDVMTQNSRNVLDRAPVYPPGVFVEDTCSICLCEFEVSPFYEQTSQLSSPLTTAFSLKVQLLNDHLLQGGDEKGIVKVINCGHAFHPSCLDQW
eukprot:CAMPEP_0114379594 /NCGR_PEP_ID=MMETSP0102-20121206/2334_1 /TAXON_ID=38822 ORGANISM="Pteridomonas danica, Strain PT" /NCGR_SAMPLE_ID=MMETSP0102 /ASSEMBLY_ACC=CAM_ASM_000212 /LENGTH=1175 /DNA_ID=CAMNT_0001534689 /DNA_START=399 /DNA_END=3923 /DNA_ORIENTATION=+